MLETKEKKADVKTDLEEPDDCHLVVGNQRLGLGDLLQGGHRGACALLQPVDDVLRLPSSCRAGKHKRLAQPGENAPSKFTRNSEKGSTQRRRRSSSSPSPRLRLQSGE